MFLFFRLSPVRLCVFGWLVMDLIWFSQLVNEWVCWFELCIYVYSIIFVYYPSIKSTWDGADDGLAEPKRCVVVGCGVIAQNLSSVSNLCVCVLTMLLCVLLLCVCFVVCVFTCLQMMECTVRAAIRISSGYTHYTPFFVYVCWGPIEGRVCGGPDTSGAHYLILCNTYYGTYMK